MKALKEFWRDESGITAAEYGIVLGLIGAAIVIGLAAFYTELGNLFSRWADWFKGTKTPPIPG